MSAVELYRSLLPAHRYEFRIDSLDRIGIPVVTASLWHEGHGLHGTGYGATEHEATRGALGELVESLAAAECIPELPRRRGTLRELGKAAVDPRSCCLPAGSAFDADTPLWWVPAQVYPTGEERWVPIELAATCFADLGELVPPSGEWLTTPITNGLGAGDTFPRAVAHGLLELLQRDGNSVAYRALDNGVVIDPDETSDDVRELLDRFDAAEIDVMVKLAATDFGLTNVYVVGRDRDPSAAGHPLMVTACGEAVHADRDRAVRKALLEYASSRSRKAFCQAPEGLAIAPPGYRELVEAEQAEAEESRALDAMVDWLQRPAEDLLELMGRSFHAERERVPLSSLPTTPGPDDPLALLEDVAGRLADAGLEILVIPLGAHAARVIVPGLEVETVTYHRCGPRNRDRLAGRGLAGTGAAPDGALPLADNSGWLHTERIDALVGDCYPLYREPDRHIAARLVAR